MALEIRDLALDDEAELHAYHQVTHRAETADGRDWTRPWTYDEMLQALREPDEAERAEAYAAFDDGRLVGGAVQWFFLLDNTQKSWLEVYVDPTERRRGVGSALAEHGVERARADGRTQVTSEATSYPFDQRDDAPALLFARNLGFRLANLEIHRRLDLPLPDGLLDSIAAEAAPHHGDYKIESYAEQVPDALLPSYVALHNLLAVEAPGGEFDWEPEALTPAIFAEHTRKLAAVGRTRFSTVAVRDGVVVALTDLVVTKGEERAEQWYTIVDRAHRGHRLGAAVKAANLRQVIEARPELREIHTTNAETNANMVDINDRLGFVPIAICPGFLRDL